MAQEKIVLALVADEICDGRRAARRVGTLHSGAKR